MKKIIPLFITLAARCATTAAGTTEETLPIVLHRKESGRKSRRWFSALAALALLALPTAALAQSDATLSNMVITDGSTFTPAFSSAINDYADSVPFTTTNTTVGIVTTDSGANAWVDGTLIGNFGFSGPISLSVGTNVISIVVISANTTVTNTYTITVVRAPGASDAFLASLTLSAGTLTPDFATNILSYATSVSYANINNLTVTATADDTNATITVDGSSVVSGSPSVAIPLVVGTNVITTVVTAQDGVTTNAYKVTVIVAADSLLASLVPSAGALAPVFSPGTNNYLDVLPYTNTSMTVTPTAHDPSATITVNGVPVASGSASANFLIGTGTNNVITTVVVSADHTSTNTYTLVVSRTDSAVYEPFDYPAGPLLGQAVGSNTGLSGTWHQGPNNFFQTASIAADSLAFPGYATKGNHVVPTANNTDVTMVANVGPQLAAAGLLNPGATLWYSALVVAENNTGGLTRQTYFGIGNGWADGFSRYGPTGASTYTGMGFTVVGLTVYAQGWDGVKNAQVQATPVAIPAGVNLIVGKITWSPLAGSGGLHTNSIYVVGPGLALPATPTSTLTYTNSDFNQSTYTNISFAGGGNDGDLPQIDEIRFGGSFAAVVGLANPVYWDLNGSTAGSGGPTPNGTWDATTLNWSLSSAGTGPSGPWTPGQLAVFSAGSDATGAYTVTVNGTQNISGLFVNSGTTVLLTNGTAGDLRMVANTPVTIGSNVTAIVQTPISDDGHGEVMSTAGSGLLILAGTNTAATGGMAINGPTRFESPSAINGTAQNVTINPSGVLVFGPSFGGANIQNALNTRIVSSSPGAIAADNYPTTAFDFNAAGLTACSLGAVGTVSYTGTLTPNGGILRIGGGGGTVILANANAVNGNNALAINGNLTLGAANNYTGGTALNAGSLVFGDNGSFGTGPLTLNAGSSGAAPTIQSADSTAHIMTNAFAINGSVNIGTTNTGDLTFTDTNGSVLVNTPIVTINNTNTTIAQSFSGNFGFTKAGTGTLYLTGASTFTNAMTITAGTLTISNLAPSSAASPIGAWPVANNTNIVSPPTSLVSGNVASYNASKSIALAGTLNYAGPTVATDRGINFTGNSIVNVVNPGVTLSIGQCLVNTANGNSITFNGAAGSSVIFGPVPNNATVTWVANIPTTLRQFNVNGRTITLSGTSTGSIPGPIYCTGGTGAIAKSGTGTWILSGPNGYNGNTTVNAGTLQFAQSAAMTYLYGNVNYGIGTIPLLSPTVLPVASGAMVALNVGGTGEFATTDGSLDAFLNGMSSSTATTGFKTGSALGLDTSNAGGSFTPDQPINLGTGAVGLTKLGTGSLVLNQVNAYTGPTTITTGTLALGSGGSIATSAAINVAGGATFDVSAVPGYALAGGQTLTGNGTVNGAVTVSSGATLSPGSGGSGTLATTGNLVLSAGSTNTFTVNASTTTNNTSVALGGAVTYGGVLNIVATGTNFTLGQTFRLFSGAGATTPGNFASVQSTGGNSPLFTFTNGVLTVVPPPPSLTNIYFPGFGYAFPDATGTNFTIVVPGSTAVTALAPTYTVSLGSVGSPVSGTSQNFTTPQTYTATAPGGAVRAYTLTVQKIATVKTGYQEIVLASGPISYWPLNETSGTTAFDIASGLNNMTYNLATLNQPGLRSDGNPSVALLTNTVATSGLYIGYPFNPSLNPGQFSVEGWILVSNLTAQYLISAQDRPDNTPYPTNTLIPTGGRWGYAIQKNNGGTGFTITVGNAAAPTSSTSVNGTTVCVAGGVYHVVATYDGSSLKLYVNGNLDGSTSVAYQPATVNDPAFSIGSRFGNTSGDCRMQDVALYGRALTPQEIQTHLVNSPLFQYVQTGTNLTFTWSPAGGTLQGSTNVAGPYTNVSGATSPWTVPITGSVSNAFWRAKF